MKISKDSFGLTRHLSKNIRSRPNL